MQHGGGPGGGAAGRLEVAPEQLDHLLARRCLGVGDGDRLRRLVGEHGRWRAQDREAGRRVARPARPRARVQHHAGGLRTARKGVRAGRLAAAHHRLVGHPRRALAQRRVEERHAPRARLHEVPPREHQSVRRKGLRVREVHVPRLQHRGGHRRDGDGRGRERREPRRVARGGHAEGAPHAVRGQPGRRREHAPVPVCARRRRHERRRRARRTPAVGRHEQGAPDVRGEPAAGHFDGLAQRSRLHQHVLRRQRRQPGHGHTHARARLPAPGSTRRVAQAPAHVVREPNAEVRGVDGERRAGGGHTRHCHLRRKRLCSRARLRAPGGRQREEQPLRNAAPRERHRHLRHGQRGRRAQPRHRRVEQRAALLAQRPHQARAGEPEEAGRRRPRVRQEPAQGAAAAAARRDGGVDEGRRHGLPARRPPPQRSRVGAGAAARADPRVDGDGRKVVGRHVLQGGLGGELHERAAVPLARRQRLGPRAPCEAQAEAGVAPVRPVRGVVRRAARVEARATLNLGRVRRRRDAAQQRRRQKRNGCAHRSHLVRGNTQQQATGAQPHAPPSPSCSLVLFAVPFASHASVRGPHRQDTVNEVQIL
eukprot:Rhum_TRINITY_DN9768_c0_g1::Rhum_TRINITY_DN9768_c0_g1_i1::g.35076::m.35076